MIVIFSEGDSIVRADELSDDLLNPFVTPNVLSPKLWLAALPPSCDEFAKHISDFYALESRYQEI